MDENPDYITLSRHVQHPTQYLVLHMRWNRVDESYGIVDCRGPYHILRAHDVAASMVRDLGAEFKWKSLDTPRNSL